MAGDDRADDREGDDDGRPTTEAEGRSTSERIEPPGSEGGEAPGSDRDGRPEAEAEPELERDGPPDPNAAREPTGDGRSGLARPVANAAPGAGEAGAPVEEAHGEVDWEDADPSVQPSQADSAEDAADDESGPARDVAAGPGDDPATEDVPPDVRSYDRFTKVDRASYDRVNEFLRDRTYITAREWAIARLCADFRTATGVEMTKIGENLPHLVPFMTDTYSPQAVNQARSAFEDKVRMAGATFLYGAMSGFFTADELDDLMYEVTEVAKFLLEVEGVELTVEEELEAEDRISAVMREVRRASEELRYDEVACPHCGEAFQPAED